MQSIKVSKATLLAVLVKNRAAHRAMYEEALDGYRKEVIKQLDAQLNRAKAGKRVNLAFALYEPQDQTKDYDRAIGMLEMSLEDDILLAENDFKCYVMDDWSWKQQFLASNSTYSKMAGDQLFKGII